MNGLLRLNFEPVVDFFEVGVRQGRRGVWELYPSFLIKNKSKHLMIRGNDFYAIWLNDKNLWSTNEQDALNLIDNELRRCASENKDVLSNFPYRILYLVKAENGMIDLWHKYCTKQMRNSFHTLDETLIFSNTNVKREDYSSKRLPYPLEKGDTPAWNRLMEVLYSPEEKRKIEWAIGSIVCGDSKSLQKFMVLYGAAGTGKSTVLNIIGQLFDGYTCVFDAKALGSSNKTFALEAFRDNPLVAIQHDGDLSHIEDNTRLNSLVSHELMIMEEKYVRAYPNRFKCFLFMGTNKPVKITDAKSGLMRRLIDVTPTGNRLPPSEYKSIMSRIHFELGAIAWHCMNVYKDKPDYYDEYVPINMLSASNDFYNFISDQYVWNTFAKEDRTTLQIAWEMYNKYCEKANVKYPFVQRIFKEELKNYFREYKDRETLEDGTRVRSSYSGFLKEKFEIPKEEKDEYSGWIELKEQESIFDKECKNEPAQYANDDGKPTIKWSNVKTVLGDIDTTKTHYVMLPKNHIVIDFDIPDGEGNKCLGKNIEEATKWPPTYTEVSKSGQGLHLHYYYEGDTETLARIFKEHVEIKVPSGNSSLRRKLSLCNDIPIAVIKEGLPQREVKKTTDIQVIKSEKGLRSMIERNLRKEFWNSTTQSINFIQDILEKAYENGIDYDLDDMYKYVYDFAANSTNQALSNMKKVKAMHFKSKKREEEEKEKESAKEFDETQKPIVFFDTEVFLNLFLANWKLQGKGKKIVRMINPSPEEIENLVYNYRLIGFNNRRYDNHILYGRMMGYDNKQLYNLSCRLINGGKRSDAFFPNAYDLSYTDIFDFASASNKMSLKKFEIKLGLHHKELNLPWHEPVPEEMWVTVAEYCDNDVLATEAVFDYLTADWTARQILADIAGMKVNDTTNSLTTRIIFENNRKPQGEFNYRDLSKPVMEYDEYSIEFIKNAAPEMVPWRWE